MRGWPTRITLPHILLVEGEEEVRFWETLLKVHGRVDIQVAAQAGKNQLAERLPRPESVSPCLFPSPAG